MEYTTCDDDKLTIFVFFSHDSRLIPCGVSAYHVAEIATENIWKLAMMIIIIVIKKKKTNMSNIFGVKLILFDNKIFMNDNLNQCI